MSIVLNWKQQPGQTLDSIEIYRYNPKDTPNPTSPGTPLVVLPGTATSYEDTSVANFKTYQYRIVSVKGTDKVMGFPIMQGFFPYTGPGPQELIRGDWNCGYFGSLKNTEFFLGAAEINALAGVAIWNQSPVLFHKFIWHDRILFIPDTNTHSSITWQQCYLYGIVWGTDDFGYAPTSTANVNQRRTVIKDGYEYVVRLPRIADYGYTASSSLSSASFLRDGEWHNTFLRLFHQNGLMPRFDDQDPKTGNTYLTPGSTWLANAFNASNPYYHRPDYPDSVTYSSYNNSGMCTTILELVLN
ncbi:putative virion structural protein [Erwinia phage vB_EamM_ChrisDB]|uniref:putative virion structural protein n=1 Tax=Erwinia phage vB_EamM_ChrisDB TaxID=1883371 RepID=UPI00081CC557|nr:putative virion structural protein [Erwinia phage vB_EamM_ChrisDB]ANZ48729.1 putative virion structural protein [Erwinia phage vB_EamM_ChrisDB]